MTKTASAPPVAGGVLDRVVADPAGRVERQLVARGDRVQLRADRPDERGELVGVARGDRLEVEVDAVGAAIADGRRDLAWRGWPRAVELPSSAFWRARPVVVQAKLWTVSTTRAWLRVGGVDDAGHLRAGPAAPADGRRAVAVPLLEVAARRRRRRRSRRPSRSSPSRAGSSCRSAPSTAGTRRPRGAGRPGRRGGEARRAPVPSSGSTRSAGSAAIGRGRIDGRAVEAGWRSTRVTGASGAVRRVAHRAPRRGRPAGRAARRRRPPSVAGAGPERDGDPRRPA